MKGQTLQEISTLVNSITQDLKSRKERWDTKHNNDTEQHLIVWQAP